MKLTSHPRNSSLPDPPLTETGIQQCKDLESHLKTKCPLASRIERIITSPMQRTCQTTLTALSWLIESETVPVEVSANWQENSDIPCDTGSSLRICSQRFPELDFSTVDPIYPDKSPGTPYAYTRAANKARGEACLKDLYGRSEKVIAVVSHAGFLRTGISRRRYANADFRIFTFGKGGKDIFEDEETERNGGGMGRSEKGIFEIGDWEFPPRDEESDESEEDGDDEKDGDYVD